MRRKGEEGKEKGEKRRPTRSDYLLSHVGQKEKGKEGKEGGKRGGKSPLFSLMVIEKTLGRREGLPEREKRKGKKRKKRGVKG